jgi:hypothetical protein
MSSRRFLGLDQPLLLADNCLTYLTPFVGKPYTERPRLLAPSGTNEQRQYLRRTSEQGDICRMPNRIPVPLPYRVKYTSDPPAGTGGAWRFACGRTGPMRCCAQRRDHSVERVAAAYFKRLALAASLSKLERLQGFISPLFEFCLSPLLSLIFEWPCQEQNNYGEKSAE